MPPLPAAATAVRIALIGTYGEDVDCVTRIYFRQFGSAPASLNAMCAGIAADWATTMKADYPTVFTLTQVIAEDLDSSISPTGAATVSTAGTLAGSTLPASSCLLVKFKIGRRYRGGHPRAYLPVGTGSKLTDAQSWDPTFAAGVVTHWTTFMGQVATRVNTAYTASGSVHANVSYYEGFTNVTYPSGRTYPRPTLRVSPVLDDVVAYSANPKVATQRRRNLTP